MDIRIIKSPSESTRELLKRRIGVVPDEIINQSDAIGLIQGKVIDMVCASDIGEKATGVKVFDVRGLCPQHMTMIALFGDTASVMDALTEINNKLDGGNYNDYSQTR